MEYLQVFDENKKMLDEKIDRSSKFTLTGNKYFMIVLLFIENDGKFLLQKTSIKKNNEIATTGGHVEFGYDGLNTVIKESKEELGLTLLPSDLIYIKTETYKNSYSEIYYTNKKVDISKLVLQEEEVESVNWYSIDEIEKLIEEGKFRKGHIPAFEEILKYKNK